MLGNKRNKREYSELKVEPVRICVERGVLAASIVNKSTIQSAGQEIGIQYDFQEKTSEGSSVFNQDWESGTM